ncbi:MAG: U32 family peptidase [Tannerella sp.]|jgi:putative protease|nr:U32 family peptidase [Tannerella sp.]
MLTARPIELLAPAKDLNCGIEAVLHGADAVYIGAPKFSARAAAGVSVEDIRQLCEFAHIYNVKVYVALNTILKDDELPEAEMLIHRLYDAGADALIIQDMGIMRLDIPPIPVHASTQTDNCTAEKVKFLRQAGFSQIVLARELTIDEIQNIHSQVPDARLEIFIHGSLCVSYSGRCYLSAALTGRSANRGECAQCCRLPYTLVDSEGRKIISNKHLLSLKDMNRSDDLEALMRAGASSFKIEGRLKDASYVKNVTAWYRHRLDEIFERSQDFYRSSVGRSSIKFEPKPSKSFNRGFTPYFLHGRDAEITSFDTPKSIGEYAGMVTNIKGKALLIEHNDRQISNGDGLVFFNPAGELEGFKVNRVEGDRLFPYNMPNIKAGTAFYRNYDHEFETLLSKSVAERKIDVTMDFGEYPDGFTLTITDETDAQVVIVRPNEKEKALKPQTDNIITQLSKLGGTPFKASGITVSTETEYFVPSSLLNEMRREAVGKLLTVRRIRHQRHYVRTKLNDNTLEYPLKKLDYTANVYNREAENFYKAHGVESIDSAFEAGIDANVPLMYTKHCLRYSLGCCPVHQKIRPQYKEPYYLIYRDKRFRLDFDCKKCVMILRKIKSDSFTTAGS